MGEERRERWPLGVNPRIGMALPERMAALTIHRDDYGPPEKALRLEEVPAPRLNAEDAGRVLVAVLATGPNFNTNFAALGLPVPVFGRGDAAAVHIPGSDAVGIVVDAGPAVRRVRAGQAVILDSWTPETLIRGYETHDGFNAQFAVVDEARALPIPDQMKGQAVERLAAMLLTYGTAYRAVVERLALAPGESILLMGGGKGTSFAGAQIAKALGARVILMGSNPGLAESLIARGIADAFVDRRKIPAAVFGPIAPGEEHAAWLARTGPFRAAVFAANGGRPVDKIFEHTGGANFPLLVSALADGGTLAFFGATGRGTKGEYRETFFYAGRRCVMDARWVWMRQKQVLFRRAAPEAIFREIGLPPGRRGLIWGADGPAAEFAAAALARGAELMVFASKSREAAGIAALERLGIAPTRIVDLDRFALEDDMPDPLTDDGRPNPDYAAGYLATARAMGRAVWEVFGPRASPDFIVEPTGRSTLHYSTFLLKDYRDEDEMPCGVVVARGPCDLSIRGSHMYRSGQAAEVLRLLASGRIVMEADDLEVTDLAGLPAIQQKMLDGRMAKPKGAARVQAPEAGRTVADCERDYLGACLRAADPAAGRYLDLHAADGIGIVVLKRLEALNALNHALLSQLAEVVAELKAQGTLAGRPVSALVLASGARAFAAGADVTEFHGSTAERIAAIARLNLAIMGDIEGLALPVVALIDGFALGGGNELAMSAHYRIVTENARIGQPEVKLGIIPGYGGMQRLPRLVGPRRAAAMAVNGEPIDGRAALAIGLADEFAPAAAALPAAFRAAARLAAAGGAPRRDWDAIAVRQRPELDKLLAEPRVRELAAAPAPPDPADLAAARRYAGRFAIEALAFGYAQGFAAGLANDARLFGEVAASASGQEWIGRFLSKDPRQGSFLMLLPD
jgi:enoyl-CoA hydratase